VVNVHIYTKRPVLVDGLKVVFIIECLINIQYDMGYSHIISKYMYFITLFIKYNGPQKQFCWNHGYKK